MHACKKGQALLTVSPVGMVCPGVGMTFTCSTGATSTVSRVRWRVTNEGTDVVDQLSLSQNGGCSHLYQYYNGLLITVELSEFHSTFNITADIQLGGLRSECLIDSDTIQREVFQIQIACKSCHTNCIWYMTSNSPYRITFITH